MQGRQAWYWTGSKNRRCSDVRGGQDLGRVWPEGEAMEASGPPAGRCIGSCFSELIPSTRSILGRRKAGKGADMKPSRKCRLVKGIHKVTGFSRAVTRHGKPVLLDPKRCTSSTEEVDLQPVKFVIISGTKKAYGQLLARSWNPVS